MMVRVLQKREWFHADRFPIAVERRDPQEAFGLHAHDFSELVLITGGTGMHVTGTERWTLSVGDVFVIGPSRPHDYCEINRLRLVNVLFEPEQIPWNLGDLASLPGYHALFRLEPARRRQDRFRSRLRLTGQDLSRAIEALDRLDGELSSRRPGFGFMATAVFMQLVGFLSRCYGRSRSEDSRALLRIAGAISHLESEYQKPIHLDELAEMAGMPKRSFLRTFKAATGTTPMAYLIQLRIRRATALLHDETLGITAIAFQVGFNDSNYFSRKFRELTGMSPRAYRRRAATLG